MLSTPIYNSKLGLVGVGLYMVVVILIPLNTLHTLYKTAVVQVITLKNKKSVSRMPRTNLTRKEKWGKSPDPNPGMTIVPQLPPRNNESWACTVLMFLNCFFNVFYIYQLIRCMLVRDLSQTVH